MRPFFNQLLNQENLVGAEIGVRRGENAREILKNLDIKKLYLIDPYAKYLNSSLSSEVDYAPWPEETSFINGMFNQAKTNIEEWKNRIEWIIDLSRFAVDRIEDSELDFCYIDGNHVYEHVLEDITLYWPKVKVGGVIGGHDYDRVDSVAKAVKQLFEEKNINSQLTGKFKIKDWWVVKETEKDLINNF